MEAPPLYSTALEEEHEDPRSLAALEGLHITLPPRMSDFEFNTLVAELVSAAIKRKIRLGDDVNVLDLFPSLDPVHSPLRAFISDIILRTIYSGFEQVHYLMEKQKRRFLEAGEACRLRGYRPHQPSSSSSSESSDDGRVSARQRSPSSRRRSGDAGSSRRESREERGRKRSKKGGGAVKKTRAE